MDRTVLITGCSSGIGRATALEFLDRGWTVYATARDTADVAALAADGCRTAELDVTEPDHVAAVVDRIRTEAGQVDCLVNNAGYAETGAVEELSVERTERMYDVNVFGPQRLVRAVLPAMRERGDGTIIAVSSAGGHVAYPVYGAYCATKYAVEGLFDALRTEVAPFGVDVVLVEPGFVKTNYYDTAEASMSAVADPESPYEHLYDRMRTLAGLGLDTVATEPETVAGVVADAAEADDPPLRHPVSRHARLIMASRWLPDGVRERFDRVLYWW